MQSIEPNGSHVVLNCLPSDSLSIVFSTHAKRRQSPSYPSTPKCVMKELRCKSILCFAKVEEGPSNSTSCPVP